MSRRFTWAVAVAVSLALLLALAVLWPTTLAPDSPSGRSAVVRLTGLSDVALATGSYDTRHGALALPLERRGAGPELPPPYPALLFAPHRSR